MANGTYLLALQGHSNLVQQTLVGWELTGITTAASGNSFTIYQNGVGENTAAVPTRYDVERNYERDSRAVWRGFRELTVPDRPGRKPVSFAGAGEDLQQGSIGGSQVINVNAFTLIGYQLGTNNPNMASRGACHGPKLVNTDLSLDKNWRVHDRFTVQFRLNALDLLNHANPAPTRATSRRRPA